MTCPECEPDCTIDEPCDCGCHDEPGSAVVYENQSIEYESDSHMPDGGIIEKTRIVVTGRTTEEAHQQFNKVLALVKT